MTRIQEARQRYTENIQLVHRHIATEELVEDILAVALPVENAVDAPAKVDVPSELKGDPECHELD